MDYQKEAGEKITGESWLIKNHCNATTTTGNSIATVPVELKSSGIIRLCI